MLHPFTLYYGCILYASTAMRYSPQRFWRKVLVKHRVSNHSPHPYQPLFDARWAKPRPEKRSPAPTFPY
jgi:hypothetical protein